MNKLLPAFCAFLGISLSAQVVVSPAGGPTQIATLLTGNGVVMSNVTITGSANAYGNFTAVNTNLGMNGGLVLTTGDINNVIGPNNNTATGTCNGTVISDPEITAIEPQATYDVCIIEMDCVPNDDTLFFNYVFGSEEYPEFVFASFNDAFGIFISGGAYNNTNVGTLPNGTTPVSIDNVNATVNPAYYIDNTNDTNLQYDGTTTNLTATIPVTPNQTYHIKIVVADAGDCIYDSGVFLQAGSFRCAGQPLDLPVVAGKDSQVSAYPVPAASAVNFRFASLENSDVNIVLQSLDGKTVLRQNSQAVNNSVAVDVSSLAEGTYIAEIIHDGITESKLISVAR